MSFAATYFRYPTNGPREEAGGSGVAWRHSSDWTCAARVWMHIGEQVPSNYALRNYRAEVRIGYRCTLDALLLRDPADLAE